MWPASNSAGERTSMVSRSGLATGRSNDMLEVNQPQWVYNGDMMVMVLVMVLVGDGTGDGTGDIIRIVSHYITPITSGMGFSR